MLVACGDNAPIEKLTLENLVLATAEDTPLVIDVPMVAEDPSAVVLSVFTAPGHGTLAGTGPRWTYTPAANYTGMDRVLVRGEDSHGSAMATITIAVGAVDDAPAANPDSFATGFDAVLTVQHTTVLANDIDIDSATLTVTGVVAGVHGTPAIVGDTITFTPEAGFAGDATFVYSISDGSLGSEATVTVNIGPDFAPLAVDDIATTDEDTELVILDAAVLANDTDPEHQTLAITAVSDPTNGTVTHTGTQITFAPAPNFVGVATFDYTITDGFKFDVGTVTVTVASVNDAPVAASDVATTDEDTALALTSATLVANDTDTDGDALGVSAVIATATTHGSVTLASGVVTYTPDADFHGTADFSYTVSDGNGGTATAAVTITVNPINDAPTTVVDQLNAIEDTTLAIPATQLAANDLDVDGDTLTVTAVAATATTNGTVTLDGGTITYIPATNYNGVADFAYSIADGNGGTANGTVAIVVAPTNDPPLANADTLSTSEDTALALVGGDLTSNDFDSEGDTLTVIAVASTATTHGIVTLAAGTIIYTPERDFHGTASFTYTIDDGNGGMASAPVTVTVTSVNDAPVAIADAFSASEDTARTIPGATLAANDSDVDGDSLTVIAVASTANTHGTVALAGGTVTYTPAANYNGPADFSYTVSDGHSGTATASVAIAVAAVNDAPVANADTQSTDEDEALGFAAATLVANDTDVDADTLTVTTVIATANTHGTVSLSGGTITYTPAPNFHGAASFGYTISDGNGGTDSAQVTVAVASINDAPVANADALSAAEDAPKTIPGASLTANDSDTDGDTLTVTAVTSTATTHGTVVLVGQTVTYSPAANYNGPADFSYTISDGNGGAATAVVAMTVAAVNDAPVANADSKTTLEDEALVFAASTLVANDTDIDGDTLTVTAVASTATTHGTVALATGTITYTPTAGYNGAATFNYSISDGHGGTATSVVTVAVTSVNDAPVVAASTGTVTYVENAAAVKLDAAITVADSDSTTLAGATIQLSTGCTSPQDVLALALVPSGITVGYAPATCTLTLSGVAPLATYQSALRLVTYANTSEAPASAGRVALFTVDDGETSGNLGTDTRNLSVTPVDDAPVAVNDAAAVTEDASVTKIFVLGNDTDIDVGPRSIATVTQPANGVVAITVGGGSLSYAPTANFCSVEPDTFTYTLTPGGSTATVSVTVTCLDDAPVAVDDLVFVADSSANNVLAVLENDTDSDGGAMTVASITQPAHGVAAIGPLGLAVTYTPTTGYCNEGSNMPRDTFTYTLTGGSSATVSVSVSCTCGLNKSTDFVVGSN